MSLLKPAWKPKTAEDRDRITRYTIYQVAKLLHKSPEEIEEMDYAWYRDVLVFENTEQLVAKIKQK